MKLKSKHKWFGVGGVFFLSLVGMFSLPEHNILFGFLQFLVSFIFMLVSVCYGLAGMEDAKVFERFFKWLKTDDV